MLKNSIRAVFETYGEKYRAQLVPGDILSRHSNQEPIRRHWLSRRHPLKRTRPCVLDVLEFGGSDDAFLLASVARLEFVSLCIGQKRHCIPTAGGDHDLATRGTSGRDWQSIDRRRYS